MFYVVLSCLTILAHFGFTESVNCKGCVPLDLYTFDKVISKFKAAAVKFDVAYPYGQKHEEYGKLAEAASNIPDLLIGEVGVKDYGEKENAELAARYGIKKDDFPVVKLFVSGVKEPFTFSDTDFTQTNLKKFVRSKSGIHIGLPGCLETFDKLSVRFVSGNQEQRKSILKEAEAQWDKTNGSTDQNVAEVYVKTMRKILDKGTTFIETELKRVQNLIGGKVSKDKKDELQRRLNILQSFQHDEL
ncbi:unnamed protein product [Timema podura]|uniref:Endoplasmic reticulum resident protein 29 n=2 Tax=Timema TaxID=61471 RepID=A0A7R9KA24_TIMGE|nr:unnamed protein product [Timema genevievae]CAG2055073.1 unnamed protein product [Timema podura]